MPAKVTVETFLDQNLLREVESRCTQEDAPGCQAACPLHLDAKGFIAQLAADKPEEAWRIYAKTIPLASIIARTCDEPCKGACKRAQRGGSLELGRLEAYAAKAAGGPAKPPALLPKKTGRVAVVGGGLRGIAAANALARKGYPVTIFEASACLGGRLRDLDAAVLSPGVLDAELETLFALGVTAEYQRFVPLHTPEEAALLLDAGFDGVFAACASGLDSLADGNTLLTGKGNILAGRRSGRIAGGNSVIYDLFDGISAATSLDRLLQGVSVDAGREREGAYTSRLYTNLSDIVPQAPAAYGSGGYDAAGAAQEAARCIQCQCNECVKKCAFLQHYKSNPRRYVRTVYNNLSIAMGAHDANGMINACALCSQCGAVCPNGLNMADVFLAARRQMVRSGKMPPSAHEFALQDMQYSMSEAFFLARPDPANPSPSAVFFPGCQLSASEPELVRAVYQDLRRRLPGGAGLMLGCCAVMAHWSGSDAVFEEAAERLRQGWKTLGAPQVIAACPTCASALGELIGIDTVSLPEVLQEIGLPGRNGAPGPQAMVLHHPCGARHAGDTKNQVRALAAEAGVQTSEGREDTESPCCGYGGLAAFANAAMSGNIRDEALRQLAGGGTPVLTYCVNCRDRFLAKGRDAWHLLELLYPNAGMRRRYPTWSQRQENRAALKRGLLRELWGEDQAEEPSMELLLDAELEQKIEETHILHSDIQAVIDQAEKGGAKLLDPQTGHCIASFRPGNVTFWAEYAPEGGAFRVFNAWCHRMSAAIHDAAG
ncbi:MAG: 4Fe-4S dicluster domain-containing protein [Treponema sp.]|jgi:Fe-S oxidoreductase|nr:4Fe-4S dicluster domain-containing protein [Treponema sp.]